MPRSLSGEAVEGRTDRTVAVQVLLETGLERLQRGARSRRDVKSTEMQLPLLSVYHTCILIGARHLPGHLIPARRLLRADRRPGPPLVKLTGHNRRPAKLSSTAEPPFG